jgi:poly(3-hydroxybutyrate) depolymerase
VRHHSQVSGLAIFCESISFADRCADGTRIDSQIFRRDSGDEKGLVAIELVRVDGGGHTWPGGKNREWLVGTTSREFSANERMWEFFQRHPLH